MIKKIFLNRMNTIIRKIIMVDIKSFFISVMIILQNQLSYSIFPQDKYPSISNQMMNEDIDF